MAPPGEHDIAEHQRIGVQCAENCGGVDGGDISNAGTYGLGLNVEMWLSGIARVSYFGDLLADVDLLADFDGPGGRAPVCRKCSSW